MSGMYSLFRNCSIIQGHNPNLQDAQKEWKTALQDYNSAGTFLLKGANEAKRNARGLEYQKSHNIL
jgi:hypothetical protein